LIHPDDKEKSSFDDQIFVQKKPYFETEYRMRIANGSYQYFQTRAIPYYDSLGNLINLFGCTININERKEAEKQK
jgi:PAS domain-containing protein